MPVKVNSNRDKLLGKTNDQIMTKNASLPSVHSLPHAHLARWFNFHSKRPLLVICTVMLVCWCFWWVFSLQQQELLAGKHLWVPPSWGGKMACDFYNHVDYAARIWWNGGDPYADKIKFFPYPPSEMRLFAWVNFMTPRAALIVWLTLMTGIIAAAARTASLWRRRLFLGEIPPIVSVVMILYSTPVLFAMERAQYDPLSLLFILAALPLLNHSSKWLQFLAGAILCLAPWTKVYPGLIFVGLIGLKRWRALAGFVVTGMVIAMVFLQNGEMQMFLANNTIHIQKADKLALYLAGEIKPTNHPLPTALASLWLGTKLSWLGLLPGKMMAVILLMLPLSWVTYHVHKCPQRGALTYPYLLWIVALATFALPVSNDYNVLFLPLAVLTVWDRRDPLMLQASLALLLIWWQPIAMPINAMALFIIKLLGLGAVAVCLVKRASEQTKVIAVEGIH
jgi:hypothetical protein